MDFSNLMVRNDDDLFRTVRSKFSINPGKFYFEVTILTAGKMRIGLAAKQMAIIDTVGNNPFSVGIDGFERCVWMNKKKYHFTKSQSCWLPGDVIGIYFDSYSKTIIFGINNQVVELDGNPFKNNSFKNIDKQALFKNDPFDSFIFASLPCHVAVSLGMFQQCYFNFNCTVIPSEFLNKLEIVGQNVNIQNSLVSFLGGANKVNSFSVFVQIGKIAKLKLESNFETWLNSLKIVLCAEGVVEAIESPMNDDDPQNLIARGRILLSVSSKLLTQIKSYH
ncbi:RING finger and SPRY domain-containing protein 1, partial [Tyrophagus putrescentiae]